MASSKLVAVFGATGKQGGSVVRALLKDSAFKVRAVTRSATSAAATELKEQGAEVVIGDLDNKDTVASALRGAYGCFLVTNFWAHMDEQRDTKQGLDCLEACKAAGIKHLVYSGLENCDKLAGIRVPHFDAKGIVEDKIKESDVAFTLVRAAAYHENFMSSFLNRAQGNTFGVGIPMGDKPLDLIHIDGFGECVRSIFNNPREYTGQTMGLASDSLTVDQIVEVFNKNFAPEKTFINFKIDVDSFAKLGFPGADDLANMFRYYMTGKCVRDVAQTKQLNPNIQSLDAWVASNKDALDAMLDKKP